MPSSSLDPDNIPDNDRQLGKGHGIDALGPSDLSDTGSDALGAYSDIDTMTGASDIGFERIATTDQPYGPVIEIDSSPLDDIDSDVDSDLESDPTMDLDLDSIADLDATDDDDEETGKPAMAVKKNRAS